MPHLDHDRLVQLGMLGDTHSPAERQHLDTCADCRHSLGELAAIPGRQGPVLAADPPDQVWQQIAAGIDESVDSADSVEGRPPSGRRARPVGRWVVAVAAAIGCLAGAGVTALVVSNDPPSGTTVAKPTRVASATLSVPTGDGAASGTATLVKHDGRWTLEVDTRGLVSDGGYFEVWLLDATGRMYALGALPEGSTARLAVPDGISIAQFNVVDISAQRFNGDPSHSRDSVLRGILRT